MASRKIKALTTETNWYSDLTDTATLQLSCLMRIADSSEAMAKNHAQLQNARDQYERWYKDERERRKRIERKLQATKGVVTKLRNQLAKTRETL